MTDNKKNIIYSYISQLVGVVTGFLLSIVLVRNLEVHEFGEYSFLGSSIILMGILVSFGLEGVKQRYITEFLAKKKYGKVNKLIFWTMFIRVISLLILGLVLFFLYEDIKKYFSLTMTLGSFVIFLGIFFISKVRQLLGTSLLTAYLKIYKEKINLIFYQITKLVSFSYVVMNGYGIKELLVAWLLVEFISLIHFVFLASNKIKLNKEKSFISNFSKKEKSRMFEFGKYQAFAVILFMFADISVDNIMIGYFIGPEAVAKYAFAMGLVMMLSNINPALLLRGMFASMFTKIYTKNKCLNELKSYYIIITKLVFISIIPISIIFILNVKNIISLVYDQKYLDVVPLLYTAIFFFLFININRPHNPLMIALEKNKLFLYTGFFSIYNAILNIFLIPEFGIMGALISTGSAGIMIFYFYLYQFKKVFKSTYFPWLSFFKVFMYCMPLFVFNMIIDKYIINLFSLALAIVFELLIFYSFLLYFKIFTNEERNILNNQFNKNIVRF